MNEKKVSRRSVDVLHVGVIAPGCCTSVGTGELTGVPPEFRVMIAPATVMVVDEVGMGITSVVLERTNVSDTAVDGGKGFGSVGTVYD